MEANGNDEWMKPVGSSESGPPVCCSTDRISAVEMDLKLSRETCSVCTYGKQETANKERSRSENMKASY